MAEKSMKAAYDVKATNLLMMKRKQSVHPSAAYICCRYCTSAALPHLQQQKM